MGKKGRFRAFQLRIPLTNAERGLAMLCRHDHLCRLLVAVAVSMLLVPTPQAKGQSFRPAISKLYRPTGSTPSDGFGKSVALNETYVIVGAPTDDSTGVNAGAAYVFRAATGAFVRTLVASDAAAEDGFGTSVTVCGSLALVGAPKAANGGAVDAGAAYLFDLATGRQVSKLIAEFGNNPDGFGSSVAMSGNRAVVGAPGRTGNQGSAFLFSLSGGGEQAELVASNRQAGVSFGNVVALTGDRVFVGASGDQGSTATSGTVYLYSGTASGQTTESAKIFPADGANGDGFGWSIAADGRYLVAGAPFDGDGGINSGSAYLFDLSSGNLVRKLLPSIPGVNLLFGNSVAISENFSLVAIDPTLTGLTYAAAYLFDNAGPNASSTEHLSLSLPDAALGAPVGMQVAICQGRVLFSSEADSDNGPNAGAVYSVGPLASPLPLRTLAKKGDFAPGAVGASLSAVGLPSVNNTSEAAFFSTLSGPGSNRGRDSGVWDNLSPVGVLTLAAKSRQEIGAGVLISSITRAQLRDHDAAMISAKLSGSGITSKNNTALFASDGSNLTRLVQTGQTGVFGATVEFLNFGEFAQHNSANRACTTYRLRQGTGGVDRTNDSGILGFSHQGGVTEFGARESYATLGPNFPGETYLEVIDRVCVGQNAFVLGSFAFVCNRMPPGASAPVQQLFLKAPGAFPTDVMTQEDPAPGVANAAVSTFLGETMNKDIEVIFRATMTGNGVTPATNEALWLSNTLVVQKGADLGSGVTLSRLLGFWPSGSTGCLFLASVAGSGVTKATDVALYQWVEGTPGYRRLLREGDSLEGPDRPKVGSILQVDVDPLNGHYLILCSLSGAASTKNQALLAGHALAANSILRLPYVALRKGTRYQSTAGVTTNLRAISMLSSRDRTGSGGKGLGQSISDDGDAALKLEFDNRSTEIATGNP